MSRNSAVSSSTLSSAVSVGKICNKATCVCFGSCVVALLLIVHYNVSESNRGDSEYWAEAAHHLRRNEHRGTADGGALPKESLVQEDVYRAGGGAAAGHTVLKRSAAPLEAITFDEAVHKPPLDPSLLDFTRPEFLHFVNPPRNHDANLHLQCPGYRIPSSKSADGKSIHEHVTKYSRYVNQYCNHTGMLQMNVEFKTYGWILDKIAHMTRIRKNHHIFDWGCGCGTMLNYFHLKYNTTGIGIDITENAIQHARHHSQPGQQFCHMDGADMRRFPSNAFDAIVSWATLYHIRRTLVQCEVVHHMVRMLKPGGIAYVGHLRTEKTQEYWKKGRCRHDNATIVRYRDYKTFHQPSWKRHQFFSVIVTKHLDDGRVVAAPSEEG
jgi:2-polyprenyl-3-methyl-5-hydroxy-6-metoxy-1,4-benzoquinol methylase